MQRCPFVGREQLWMGCRIGETVCILPKLIEIYTIESLFPNIAAFRGRLTQYKRFATLKELPIQPL